MHPLKKGLVTSPPFTERFVIGNDYEMITIVRFEIFSIKKILEKIGSQKLFPFRNFQKFQIDSTLGSTQRIDPI